MEEKGSHSSSKILNDGRNLEDMSWDEAYKRISEASVLLVPLGSGSKEHGYHLPLNTDLVQAKLLTAILRKELTRQGIRCVTGPPISYSYYPAFTLYPASISLTKEAAIEIVIAYCRDYAKAGCKKIFIVNTGISTITILKEAQEKLREKFKIEMDFFDYNVFYQQCGFEGIEIGGHAGARETSLMLALAPELVEMEKIKEDYDVPDAPGPLYPRFNPPPSHMPGMRSDSGVWGAPSKATTKLGNEIIAAFGPFTVKQVQKLITREPSVGVESQDDKPQDGPPEKKRKMGEPPPEPPSPSSIVAAAASAVAGGFLGGLQAQGKKDQAQQPLSESEPVVRKQENSSPS